MIGHARLTVYKHSPKPNDIAQVANNQGFYVEYGGFTEICTVANMSLVARLFLCGI